MAFRSDTYYTYAEALCEVAWLLLRKGGLEKLIEEPFALCEDIWDESLCEDIWDILDSCGLLLFSPIFDFVQKAGEEVRES